MLILEMDNREIDIASTIAGLSQRLQRSQTREIHQVEHQCKAKTDVLGRDEQPRQHRVSIEDHQRIRFSETQICRK